MEHTARNFHAHGGAEWVIGGKLTFLPGATVEGAEGLFDLPRGGESSLPYIADSEAGTVGRSGRTSTRCSLPYEKPASWQERRSSEVRMDACLGG